MTFYMALKSLKEGEDSNKPAGIFFGQTVKLAMPYTFLTTFKLSPIW
jgi:hypothetical protein